MNLRTLVGATLAVCSVMFAHQSLAAIAVGDTLQVSYLYPTVSDVYTGPYFTTYLTPGQTTEVVGAYSSATFYANEVVLVAEGYGYADTSFNGIEVTDLTNTSAFSGWGVVPLTNFAGYSEYIDDGSIFVSFAGGGVYPGGQQVTVGSIVPEPATWAMMLIGFGALGAAVRARRKLAGAVAA